MGASTMVSDDMVCDGLLTVDGSNNGSEWLANHVVLSWFDDVC